MIQISETSWAIPAHITSFGRVIGEDGKHYVVVNLVDGKTLTMGYDEESEAEAHVGRIQECLSK